MADVQPNPECPDRRRFSARCDSATSATTRRRPSSVTYRPLLVPCVSYTKPFDLHSNGIVCRRPVCADRGHWRSDEFGESVAHPSFRVFVRFISSTATFFFSTPFSCVGYISVDVETVRVTGRPVRIQTVKRPPKMSNKTSSKNFLQ